MSGPFTTSVATDALGANPYITKLKSGTGSGLSLQPVQQYKGMGNSPQMPAIPAPNMGSSTAGGNSTMQQLQQLMQWRQQVNGGNGGLFSQFGNTPAMNSNPGGVWSGNPDQLQVGPANPSSADLSAAAADAPAQQSMASSMPSGMGAGGTDVAGQPFGGGGGGAGAAGSAISGVLGSIGSYFTNQAQADAKIGQNLRPTIDIQAPQYPVPVV